MKRIFTALLGCLIFTAVFGFSGFGAQALAREVVDITGTRVGVPDAPRRIVLGEGRLVYALEPLEGAHLFDRIAGWQGEFRGADAQNYRKLLEKFPQEAKVPVIGLTTADTVSPEKVLDLHPDLAVFSISGHGPGQSDALTARLRAAHIPVVFVDFREKPVRNTAESMRILGRALDREPQAEAFARFYESRLTLIRERVQDIPPDKRPAVFIDMLAGARSACCHTAGRGNMGALIEAAGGRNIAAPLLPGYLGEISAEQLMASDPDVLILDGTQGPEAKGPGLKMGAEVDRETAEKSLRSLLDAPWLKNLRAVKTGRVYGLWHSFYDNPFNILAVEAMAKWFYPDRFADLDPDADFVRMQEEFTPLPPGGTYWIGVRAS